ncbi:MAG: hypothetical protein PHE58_01795 [Candidatus Omnitrophica bacterium]|nr:hypothetical protein [Candidatus Omnitrophota bacterium]
MKVERIRKTVCFFLILVPAFCVFLPGNLLYRACAQQYELEKRDVTGYYYDPASGKVLQKLDNLTPSEVEDYFWRKDHIKEINVVRGLTYKQFNTVKSEYLKFLSPKQISSIPDAKGFTKYLTVDQRAQLTAEQVQALNVQKISIGYLTDAQRMYLSKTQVQKIGYIDFPYLPVSKITDLSSQQIGSIPDSKAFKKLTIEQRSALTQNQVQALNTAKISIVNLPVAQREYLTTAQVQTLGGYSEFKNLPVSKIQDLTPKQVSSIPNKTEFNKISTAQVQAFTQEQVLAIRASYYNQVKKRLSVQQLAWRP